MSMTAGLFRYELAPAQHKASVQLHLDGIIGAEPVGEDSVRVRVLRPSHDGGR